MGKTILVALSFILASGCAGERESLRASFDHSEWHPPAMLKLDVPSGGFEARFRDGTLATGRFSAAEMRQIEARLAAARAAGFEDPTCGEATEGYRRIVVSNGGQEILELRGPVHLAAPVDMGCWTPEATALHDAISRILSARGQDWTMPRQRRGPLARIG